MSFAFFTEWKHVRSFDDLVRVNASFVRGELQYSPYSCGPLMPDSQPLVPNLLALHQFGLVTTNGQSNECKHGRLTRCGDNYFDSEQKPYLCFTMLKSEDGTKLINEVLNSDRFVMKVTDSKTGRVDSNMSTSIKRYNVTRDRSAPSLDKLVETPWREFTNLWRNDPDLPEDSWPDHIAHFLQDKAVCVDVAMKVYGTGDLESELLTICKAVGMQQTFDIGQ